MATSEAPAAVPDVFKPPPGNPRFPLVDSLRAIAALSIFFGHVIFVREGSVAGVFGGLGAGLTVFFVISGFLLYRPFVAARLIGRRGPRLSSYVRRRLLRIVPAYWTALTLVAIYPGLVAPRDHWWAYYGLVQSYIPAMRYGGLPQAWSLSFEFTFYAMLPAIAFAVVLAGRRLDRWHLLAPELAMLASLVLAVVAFELHPIEALSTPVSLLLWFAVGMALAVASAVVSEGPLSRPAGLIGRHPGACWSVAAAFYVAFAFQPVDQRASFSTYVLQAVFAGLLVLPAIFAGEGRHRVHRLLAHPALAWLGLVSYGIFLWHGPVVTELSETSLGSYGPFNGVLLLAVLSVVLTVPLAALSYYVVERPLLRFKR